MRARRWGESAATLCVLTLLLLTNAAGLIISGPSRPLRSVRTRSSSRTEDAYESFSPFEKLLFQRFADSVATELDDGSPSATTYSDLMAMINRMTFSRPLAQVNAQGKNMLVRLFPPWLLPMYKVLIQRPFPTLSAVMNCWVTKWTTNWLMGKSQVYDLPDDGGKQQGLLIEKCAFLESTGCVRTCLHACKIPTQAFFHDEMGLSVTLRPNTTDLSCRFLFGVEPMPLDLDEVRLSPCLDICSRRSQSAKTITQQPCVSLP